MREHTHTNDDEKTDEETNQFDRDRLPKTQSNKETESAHESAAETENSECSECGGEVIQDQSAGEVVCSDCGLVLDDSLIDYGPEWRAYNQSERNTKARTGPPRDELRHDKGMSSTIDWRDKDAYGNLLSSAKRAQMSRLRKWDFRSKRDSADRNLSHANGEIKRMGSALNTPKSIRNTAGSLYRQAHNKGLIPGRSIEGMASAALYAALRIHEEPRSLDEITSVSHVDRKSIQRAYRYISQEMDLELEPTNPSRYIPRFATDIGISQDVIRIAETLLEDVDGTHHVSGNDPTVLAASALYAATIIDGNLITQKAVKEAADVTEVSIRNNYEMFLLESDASPITQEHINTATSPSSLAATVNETVDYIDTDETSDTNGTNSTGDNTTTGTHTSPDSTGRTTSDGSTDGDTTITLPDEIEPNDNGEYDCINCDGSFKSERGLRVHYGQIHENGRDEHTDENNVEYPADEYNFSCPECPRVSDSYTGISIHIGHQHKAYDASQNTRETYAVDPDEHPVKKLNGQSNGDFNCDYCTSVFETYKGLRIHQGRQHNGESNTESSNEQPGESPSHPDDQYNFACPQCPCIYSTYHGVLTHIGHQHPDETKAERDVYAVNPETHPETHDDTNSSASTTTINTTCLNADITAVLNPPRSTPFIETATAFLTAVEPVIDQTVISTAQTLLAVGGKDIGQCKYRVTNTAIGSALYAATRLMAPITGAPYTQHEIADLANTTESSISNGYSPYMQLGEYLYSDITQLQ